MLRTSSRLARRRDCEDGAAAVEFALILVPFLVLIFGTMQYGFYFYSSQVGASTAREAVRRLAVGDCDTTSTLQAFVVNRLGSASLATPTVTTSYTDGAGAAIPGGRAAAVVGGKVTITITFQSLDMNFPFVPVPNGAQVTRVVDSRMEDLTSSGCA